MGLQPGSFIIIVCLFVFNMYFPTLGLLDFMLESAVAMLLHHAPHPISRQSSSPVDPAEYPARASGSR